MFIYVVLPALITLVYVFWAGAPDTFDHVDICKCPSLFSPLRTFCRYVIPPFPPQHPDVLPRIIFSLAFRSMATSTRARKRLLKDSDLDASIRLIDAVRDTPTASTPPVVPPNPSSNSDAAVALRKHLVDQHAAVDVVYKGRLHRAWAKGIREDILGSKKHHYRGTDDTDRLSELVVQLRTEFESAGLDLTPFDLDDPTSLVIEKVNGLLYDVLALVVERNSVADTWLRGTDSSADRDGRRALIDIIKGSVPAALRESHQQEHAALRYPAGVDPQPILAREQRLVRDNRAPDWQPTDETRKLSLYNRLDPVFYAAVKVRYPLAGDLSGVTLRSLQALVVAIFQAWAQSDEGASAREKQTLGAGGKPSALITSSEYAVLLEEIAALKALVQGNRTGAVQRQPQPQPRGKQHPRGHRVGVHPAPSVGFDRESMKAKPLCHRCRKAGKGDAYHAYRDCPLGGRQHSSATAAAFCIPIEEEDAEGLHTLALVQVFQEAADDGPEAFARAASAYGPPAVLSAGGIGGIDVSAYGFSVPPPPSGGTDDEDILRRLDALTSEVQAAQEQVHYTHASFVPGSAVEEHASALVCGPAAAAGITPEGQVPAGGAAASASAVPAPAMPVSQVEDVQPAPVQSARVTTTEATHGEFGGFVQTVNHAAVHPSDLTGYDTDDYEDFADGSFRLKPRGSPPSANHVSGPPVGEQRTYGCGKPPWGFPATVGPWGIPFLLSLVLCISIMGVAAVPDARSATEMPSPGGDLDWEAPSFFSTNDFLDPVMTAQGLLLPDDVPQLQPPEPPDTLSFLAFQDLAQADLGIDMAFYYGMALHESGPLDAGHYYGAGYFTSYYGMDFREATADYFGTVD
ncbi:hypothetical protein CYMTET_48204 [Cymbomonas tetramitiformis]|uniref:Uncharacterized protein n=1 Tax=Cymbomonas tetramitiformis TaxID=36881 RepID=A0AAE0BSU9_9CHLO|nr:hypothetical protein CYMTET_48204 [Cymbomonas tetramitiformis]